jgi:hypothetical protein
VGKGPSRDIHTEDEPAVSNIIDAYCFYEFFIRVYLLHRGEFIVTIPIRLIVYISYIVPIISPPQPPPHRT